MIVAALAVALQVPFFLAAPAFTSAHADWIRCTHREIDVPVA
jgi:hypothetical protein